MTEIRINDRRNWKAETFPYDYYIPDESKECSYCLTDKQAEILLGIIEPLGWRTRWWSDTDVPISLDEIEAFRADLSRRLMMGCCDNLIYRYTVDGILQSSSDDGETWDDAPQDDIRTNAPQFPPIEGEDTADKKCIAAAGMVALIKEQIGDNLTDDMSRYTLSHLIADWVNTFIGTSNPFTALLTVITNQIFALVISAVRAAINDTVYDLLMCIFYCRMANDATFNDGSWGNVRTDITEQIGGVAGIFFEHLVYLLGSRGLTNLARSSGATSGDCSGCDCSSCADHYDGSSGLGHITARGDNWIEAESTYQTSPFGYNMIRITSDLVAGHCCTIVSCEALDDTIVGTLSAGNDTFPNNQTFFPSFPSEYCWLQWEKDGVEAPFKVRINFL